MELIKRKNKLNQYKNSFPITFFNTKVVIVSGGFDPIHSGHLHYIKAAKHITEHKSSTVLIVGLNSDAWLERKKGKAFMPFEERAAILNNLYDVDAVIQFNDDDDTAIELIKRCRRVYPDTEIIFCNGGDRTEQNIPEMEDEQLKNDNMLTYKFGVGGNTKKNSSSWILDDFKAPKTDRPWGYFRVLHEPNKHVKLKELTVEPGQSLSMQQHFKRKELWFISEGAANVYALDVNGERKLRGIYTKFDTLEIMDQEWHQLCNEQKDPLKVIEIQYGLECSEEDIKRK